MKARLYMTRDGRIVAQPSNTQASFGGLDPDELGDDFGDDEEDGLGDDFGARRPKFLTPRERKAAVMNARRAKTSRGQHKPGVGWAKTALVGATASTSADSTVTIRPQFNFKATDIAVTSNSASSTAAVTSVNFGDRQIWSNAEGMPISVLGPTSFLRNLVRGSRIRGGLDISVGVNPGGTEIVTIVIIGFKQTVGRC